jgi:hypothetical protein
MELTSPSGVGIDSISLNPDAVLKTTVANLKVEKTLASSFQYNIDGKNAPTGS